VTTLRRLASTTGGAGFPHAEQGHESGDLPFIKVSDFNHAGNERVITTCNNWVTKETARRLRATVVPSGSVLLPKVGAALLGNARRIVRQPSVFDNNILGVVPEKISSRYLHYWLTTVDAVQFAKPGPVPSMDDSAILNLRVPVVRQHEQRAIADYLDTETNHIDTLITKKRRMIELLERRLRITARELTTRSGATGPLRRFVRRVKTGTTPPASELGDLHGSDVAWYSPGDVGPSLRMYPPARSLTLRALSEGWTPEFPTDSTLIVGIGATAGHVGHNFSRSTGNQQMTCITPNVRILPKFLSWQLWARSDELRETAPYTTLPILNNEFLRSTLIVVPSLTSQEAVVDQLDRSADRLLATAKGLGIQIGLLLERRQSLITQAVMGELAAPSLTKAAFREPQSP